MEPNSVIIVLEQVMSDNLRGVDGPDGLRRARVSRRGGTGSSSSSAQAQAQAQDDVAPTGMRWAQTADDDAFSTIMQWLHARALVPNEEAREPQTSGGDAAA
jgi:hypothetical protein